MRSCEAGRRPCELGNGMDGSSRWGIVVNNTWLFGRMNWTSGQHPTPRTSQSMCKYPEAGNARVMRSVLMLLGERGDTFNGGRSG